MFYNCSKESAEFVQITQQKTETQMDFLTMCIRSFASYTYKCQRYLLFHSYSTVTAQSLGRFMRVRCSFLYASESAYKNIKNH